jgi:CAAX protease family protein
MRGHVQRHPIAWFLAVTFAVTWGAWLVLAGSGTVVGAGFAPLYLVGLVGPLAGALVTTAVADGRVGVRGLLGRMTRVRCGFRWWAVAIGVPVAIAVSVQVVLVGYSMFLLAPVELPTWRGLGAFTGFPITNAIVLWVALVAIVGFGEETGWRGFLLPRLQRRWSPLAASLIVAVIWGVWHVPAFFVSGTYRAMPIAMIPMFFAGLVCGSILLTGLYNRSRRSIALVAVWHGTFDLFTGTVAARGALAAVESTVVIAIALVLVGRELVASHRERIGQPSHHVLAPT